MTDEDLLRRALARCESVAAVELLLRNVLSDGLRIGPDGQLLRTRQRAGRVRGMRILVHTRDHDPPHFHVLGEDWEVKLAISDCAPLEGEVALRRRDREAVAHWFFRCGGASKVRELWIRAHGPESL